MGRTALGTFQTILWIVTTAGALKDKPAKEKERERGVEVGLEGSSAPGHEGLSVRPTALEVLWGNGEPQKDGSS